MRAGIFLTSLVLSLSVSSVSHALDVNITLLGNNVDQFLNEVGLNDVIELENELEQLIRENVVPDEFLGPTFKSHVIAGKGLGVDYASNAKYFTVGISAGFALSPVDFSNTDIKGIKTSAGGQVGLTVGVNLKPFIKLPLTIYASGFHYETPEITVSDDSDFDASINRFSLMGQYKILPAINLVGGMVKWGGLDLSGGMEFTKTEAGISVDDIDANTNLDSGAELLTLSSAELTADVSSFAIPLEVSSNIRLLYFLTLYMGLGLDLPVGDASADITLDTNIRGRLANGTIIDGGTAAISVEDAEGSDILPRFFFGTQLNISVIKLFGQLNVSDSVWGASFGLRVAY